MLEKIILQNRKGQKIVATKAIPKNTIIGTAILQHGYGGTKEQAHIQTIQHVLIENGFQVINFDTTNSFGESEGTYRQARLGLHAEDFEDVAQYIFAQAWSTGKRLVSGHSMGGFSVARYAATYEVDICIPFAPVVSGELSFEAHKTYNPDELLEREKAGILIQESQSYPGVIKEKPREAMTERLDHDLIPMAKNIHASTLCIVGEEDTSCPPEHIYQLYHAIPHTNKDIRIVAGAPHTFKDEDHLRILADIIHSWIRKIL